MITCTLIELLDVPAWVPAQHLDDGRLYLDLSEADFSIKQSRIVGELNDINKISADQTLSFDLPMTPKNHLALGHLINPNTYNRNRKGIRVRAWQGVHIIKQDTLFVLTDFDGDEIYSVELRYSDHWVQLSGNQKLCELDLGEFEFTTEGVKEIQSDHAKYEDGDLGIYYPLVNYGQQYRRGKVITSDFRPLHHVLSVLQKGFCQIGWQFRSPFLETDYGRRLIAYLLNPTLGKPVDEYAFEARLSQPIIKNISGSPPPPFTVVFDNEINDPSNSYDDSTGIYSGVILARFISQIDYRLENNRTQSPETRVTFELIHETSDGTKIILDTKTIIEVNFSDGQTTLISDVVALAPLDKLYVTAFLHGTGSGAVGNLRIKNTSNFYNEPVGNNYSEGDIVDLARIINCDYSLLDLFKGIAHYCRAKIETDWNKRIVTMYPPNTVEVHGEEAEGYYRNTIVDFSELIQPESKRGTSEQFEIERYIRMQFKSGNDAAVNELKLPADSPLYSKQIDLGKELTDTTKIFDNPFFEPTLNKVLSGIGELAGGPSVPHMIDNTESRLTFDIGPRLLYCHGLTLMEHIKQDYVAAFRYNDDYTAQIPLSYQRINGFEIYGGGDFDKVVVYGNNKNDAYNLFWKEDIKALFDSIKLDMLVFLDLNQYSLINFRDKFVFNYNGMFNNCRIVEIRDYNGCSDVSTPVLFIPDSFTSEACEVDDDPPRDTDCYQKSNDLSLNIIHIGNCYTAVLGGTTELTIQSVTYEWKYLDDAMWTSGNSVCEPSRAFVFRVIVVFEEDCPDLVLTKVIDPCTDSIAFLQYDFDINTLCLGVSVGGVDPALIETIIIEYELDGGTRQTYTGPICQFFLEACFFVVITFNNGCDPIEIEGCFNLPLPPFPDDLCIFDIGVICEVNELGTEVVPLRTGIIRPEYILLDLIKYRYSPDDEPRIWDEVTPLDCPVEIQRVVIFCNNLCPPICTEWVQCYCDCIPFIPGDKDPKAICN